MTTTAFLDELAWRGLLFQQTDGAAAALARGPVTGYCGFDPTASSLHAGNLVAIMSLVHLQRAGHRPVALVGGGTGMIGDPSGKSSERQLLTPELVDANIAGISEQLSRVLDFDGPRGALMRNNADWLRPLGLIGFLRDTGKHFTVNYMLQKDSVDSRIGSETGISFTEFTYMLLQAYDFAELFRRDGVTFQLGGSDQWGNITAGTTLVRKVHGAEAHGVTLPLLTTSAGTKFGKSESGAVWLDAARTSPYQFYQFWIGADDRDVGRYLRTFTLLERAEIEALDEATVTAPEKREAQQLLARSVTTMIHGADAAQAAVEVSVLLFAKGDPSALSSKALEALAREVPTTAVEPGDSFDTLSLFTSAGLTASKGEARRLLQQGGLSVNGAKLTSDDTSLGADRLLRGQYLLLRKGARDYALITTITAAHT
ncbi:MAG TPA: tyrosine--tRNA ligase [Gemmatimonadaceae bacterium]|nr:tyrosine--tRNA ligase [Gemmatimonadaceae bacterium]